MRFGNLSQLHNICFTQLFKTLFDFYNCWIVVLLCQVLFEMLENLSVNWIDLCFLCNIFNSNIFTINTKTTRISLSPCLLFCNEVELKWVSLSLIWNLPLTDINFLSLNLALTNYGSRYIISTLVHLELRYFFLINLLLDLIEQLSCSLNNDSKEFSTLQLLRSYLHTTIPNTNNEDNVFDLHLLEQMQQFLTSTIFTIIVKAFCHNLTLWNLI